MRSLTPYSTLHLRDWTSRDYERRKLNHREIVVAHANKLFFLGGYLPQRQKWNQKWKGQQRDIGKDSREHELNLYIWKSKGCDEYTVNPQNFLCEGSAKMSSHQLRWLFWNKELWSPRGSSSQTQAPWEFPERLSNKGLRIMFIMKAFIPKVCFHICFPRMISVLEEAPEKTAECSQ